MYICKVTDAQGNCSVLTTDQLPGREIDGKTIDEFMHVPEMNIPGIIAGAYVASDIEKAIVKNWEINDITPDPALKYGLTFSLMGISNVANLFGRFKINAAVSDELEASLIKLVTDVGREPNLQKQMEHIGKCQTFVTLLYTSAIGKMEVEKPEG